MEIVEDGRSGLLVTPGSVEELRQAIQWLLANPDKASAIAQIGKQRAQNVFSLENLFSKLSTILSELKPNLHPPG